jgi:hypothetical protein
MSAAPSRRRLVEEADVLDILAMLSNEGVRVGVEGGRVIVIEGDVSPESAVCIETLRGRERALARVLARPDLRAALAAWRRAASEAGRHSPRRISPSASAAAVHRQAETLATHLAGTPPTPFSSRRSE